MVRQITYIFLVFIFTLSAVLSAESIAHVSGYRLSDKNYSQELSNGFATGVEPGWFKNSKYFESSAGDSTGVWSSKPYTLLNQDHFSVRFDGYQQLRSPAGEAQSETKILVIPFPWNGGN